MINTINLVNIHHHTITVFFLVMRTFKIHSLSNSQMHNLVNYSHHAVDYIPSISPELIYLITGNLYFPLPSTTTPTPRFLWQPPFGGVSISSGF